MTFPFLPYHRFPSKFNLENQINLKNIYIRIKQNLFGPQHGIISNRDHILSVRPRTGSLSFLVIAGHNST